MNPTGEGIEVAIDCPRELPLALGDREQLRIALGNLIRNARDAMPHGGLLTIAGRSSDGVCRAVGQRLGGRYADRKSWRG